MRKATFVLLLGIAVAVVASVSPIEWKSTSIDLGQISKDEVAELSFEFTNNDDVAVRIIEAKGSCGCTNVDFSKGEIQPGETAFVTGKFKSGKLGAFKKNIRIKTSASEDYTYLHFKGEVVE